MGDAIAEESPSIFVVFSYFNTSFWHNVYSISTIFYKYNDMEKNEKYSILSLCDGDISILNNCFNFESAYAELFCKFGLDFF